METLKSCILVPFSFCEHSFEAGRIAFYWAEKMNTSLLFLHVTTQKEISLLELEIDKVKTLYINEIENGTLPDISFEFHLKEGVVEEVIKRYDKKLHPTLVIMGTRDKKQKQADLIGSVTAEVMEQIKTPVLAISPPPRANIHNLAYALKKVLSYLNRNIVPHNCLKVIFQYFFGFPNRADRDM